jgi:hypothetical protein
MCTRCWVQSRVCLRSGRSSRDSQPLFWSTCPWKAAEPKRARQPDSQTQRVSVGGARGAACNTIFRKLAVTTTMTSKRKREEVVAAGVEVQYSLANALDEGVLACAIAQVANDADDPTVGHTTDTQRIMGAVGRVLEPVQPFRERDGKHSSERKKKKTVIFFSFFSFFPKSTSTQRCEARPRQSSRRSSRRRRHRSSRRRRRRHRRRRRRRRSSRRRSSRRRRRRRRRRRVRRRSRPTSTPTLSLSWANTHRRQRSTKLRGGSASRST